MFPSKKQKIREYIDKIISPSPYNDEMKDRIVRSLTGEYTQEEIDEYERRTKEYLAQIEQEMINKHCIQSETSKVFYNVKPEDVMCQLSIEDEQVSETNSI